MGSPGDVRPTSWRRVVGASVRGPSHTRQSLPNQDAMGWLPEMDSAQELVVAVADGHGSKKCFRSHVGSRLAVEVGLAVGSSFLAGAANDSAPLARGRPVQDLPGAVVEDWKRRVDADLARYPLTESEMSELRDVDGVDDRRIVQMSPRLAYGTTLLLAVVAARWIVVLQIGDGDVLLVSPAGKTSRPLPPDPRLIANETTSLSASSAEDDVRIGVTAVDRDDPALMVLATDGFSNAYTDDEAFLQVGPDLLAHLRQSGVQSIADRLEAWLETASRHDGDDVTVVVISFQNPDPEPGRIFGSASASNAPTLGGTS
jgi:serine/threonine protein phosphatase PrpC